MVGATYTVGRILVPIIFIVLGIQKLLGIEAFSTLLATSNIYVPPEVEEYLRGMSRYMALAYFISGLEVLAGFMILIGLKARWGAVVLVFYVICRIYFVHHFWDMSGAESSLHQIQALMQVSILGALLLIAAIGSGPGSIDGRPASS